MTISSGPRGPTHGKKRACCESTMLIADLCELAEVPCPVEVEGSLDAAAEAAQT